MGEGEKFGGAATQGLTFPSDGGREPPASRSTPATLEDAEGCFDSLAGLVATESATLAELVKTNATLTTTNATLTATILKLTKVVNDLTEKKGPWRRRRRRRRKGRRKALPQLQARHLAQAGRLL